MADDLIQRLRRLADAIARKDAEIDRLKFERDNYANACENSARDLRARDVEIAELQSQLAALRERVEKAPVVWIDNGACEQDGANLYLDGGDTYFASDDIRGKRVALVALEE